jgi:SAM-dependent methyltransferase
MQNYFYIRKSCPVCSSIEKKIIVSIPFTDDKVWCFLDDYYESRIPKNILVNGRYVVAQCRNCGLLFQEQVLTDDNLVLLYENWISAEDSLNKKLMADLNLFKKYAFEIEGIAKRIKKRPYEINVLEYGMGWGYWTNLAKAFGFNVCGVELSETRSQFAQKNGIKILKTLSGEKKGTFDYIYSNQVFEHLINPRKVLQELTGVLSRHGIIHIQVPDGRMVPKRLLLTDFKIEKAVHPLEHINCFNRNSLMVLAKTAGLKLVAPIYRPDFSGVKPLVKSNLRYFYDLFFSTQVFLSKS